MELARQRGVLARMVYARLTRWLSAPQVERRVALLAFVCALPALGMGLHADD